ncbi:MAG: amino acid ABC transporter permease [Clostridia bacterium]|nr:amino acid ABC transporter permease [Clostridia bacterium]
MNQIIQEYGIFLLEAMGQTLLLALLGLFFGCIIGVFFGLLSVVDNKVCNVISLIYVNIIRGVPMIVLAFFIYLGIPYAVNNSEWFKGILSEPLVFTALTAGSICLSLNCGAYMAEIIRAGIEAIDPGQMEAARSLGLPYWKSMFRVVLPQAIKNMIPSIVNQFIITLKDTSILSVIGFPELVNKAQNVISITFKSFQVWIIVGIMYLIIILALQFVAKMLERRLNRGRRHSH